MKIKLAICAALGTASLCSAQNLFLQDYFFDTVASNLAQPVSIAFPSMNTQFVCEKNTGKLRVVTNGIAVGDAIDLAVTNDAEQGLLGVVLDPGFDRNGFAYLFYSRAATDGGAWLDDRVEKFLWNGVALSFVSTVMILGPHPDWENPGYHHGGYIKIGPDEKLYIQRGDMARYGCFEMNNNPNIIGAAACIYRINLDGTVPADNPFAAHPDASVKRMFLYGFRNGYGMTWDSQTGRMWYTENGPEVYDEINIGEAGMNSGWRLIMGPDDRNATYVQNNHTSYDEDDLIYLPGAFYRDPEFSYLTPIGITGIEFFNSDKYHPNERGDALILSTNLGRLMKLDLNVARDGFVLSGGLSDQVADNPAEVDSITIGTGWGGTTDGQIGPDGYMYVVSYSLGKVFRIRPKVETIVPGSFTMFRGSVLTGNLASLSVSDDNRLEMRPGPVFTNAEPPIQIILNATSPFSAPSSMSFMLESHASTSNIEQKISLYNFQTAAYEVLDTRTATTSDSTVVINVTTNVSRFVEAGTRNIRARVSYRATGAVFVYPWKARIDLASWTITR
ncbi:MAG: PQQ-dependent sugar dehydrogenase [Armatimonadetes bacterium]|nr:PQQ-dependent sugar dehydrogenase [Armatimonadota bacterium]